MEFEPAITVEPVNGDYDPDKIEAESNCVIMGVETSGRDSVKQVYLCGSQSSDNCALCNYRNVCPKAIK